MPKDTVEELIGSIDAKVKKFGEDKADKSTVEGLQTEIKALKDAIQKRDEEASRAPTPQLTGDEMGLKSFIGDDGSIQFKSKTVKDPELGEYEKKGLLTTEQNFGEWHRDFKSDYQDYTLAKMLCKGNPTPRLDRKMRMYARTAPLGMRDLISKALFDGAGSAADLVPDQYRAEIYIPYQQPTLVEDLFEEDNSMIHETLTVPTLTKGGTPRRFGQFTSNNPDQLAVSDPQFSNVTLSLDGLFMHYLWNNRLEEDAAIVLASTLRTQMAVDIRNGIEDAILNGDSAATHQDTIASWNPRSFWNDTSSFGGTMDHRRSWRGLRAAAVDKNTTLDISSFDFAKLMQLVSKTGDFSLTDKVLIAPLEWILDSLMPLEQFATLDKYGPMATAITGEIGKVAGMSVVPSKFMTADLAATGLYTGSGAYRGVLIVPKATWKRYMKRGQGIIIEQQRDIRIGGVHMVANKRMTFGTLEPETSKNVAYGIQA